jgi:hypothetical protein
LIPNVDTQVLLFDGTPETDVNAQGMAGFPPDPAYWLPSLCLLIQAEGDPGIYMIDYTITVDGPAGGQAVVHLPSTSAADYNLVPGHPDSVPTPANTCRRLIRSPADFSKYHFTNAHIREVDIRTLAAITRGPDLPG